MFLVLGPSLPALAQGPPCWDKVPPSAKYARKHVVSGGTDLFATLDSEVTHSLSVDGLYVDAKLIDGDIYVEVEIIVTNCSSQTAEINPSKFSLSVADARGVRRLTPLDPTHFVHFPKTGKTFPALVPQNVKYGLVGAFWVFFTRDGNAKSSNGLESNYSLALSVPIEDWQLDFTFPRKTR